MSTPTPAQQAPDGADQAEMSNGPVAWASTADLQDSLLVASHDLDRLQRLLDGASQALMGHFCQATHSVNQLARQAARCPEIETGMVHQVEQHLSEAVTAMQFQDLASQLIAHTHLRLRLCTDLLARELMGDDDAADLATAQAPLRPNPVTQNEMHAGSIELF